MKSCSNNSTSYKIIFAYIGILMIIIGAIILLPLLILIAYPHEVKYAPTFIIPSIISMGIGILLSRLVDFKKYSNISLGGDAIIVVATWIIATIFSSMPFILLGEFNFTQAYFEAVSGWTTTGLSVVNVENIPKIYLIHRSIMQFFGGIGIVLVMVSALSATFGMRLYNSEGHSDKLLPNLIKSSRMILTIYVGYVLSGTILYYIFDMPLFDALNHSIAALSTGGFSVRGNSIGEYNSFSIELITIILMLLGTTNFAAHLLLLKGKFKKFFKLGEVRFMLILLGVTIPLVTFVSLNRLYGSLSRALRVAAFELVSALSTTGFSTVGYGKWPSFAILVMISLMVIGGGAGSTAGGIKLNRIYLIMKRMIWNLKRKFKPEHVVSQDSIYKPEGKVYIEDSNILDASNYAFTYIILFIIGTGVITAYGYPLQDAMFEFASSLGTVGLSVGITGISAPSAILWIEILGMLFGRLEIWVIFIAIVKIFKRNN
ncbi:TrkH family potassium uptake protein [Clostridium sp. UBA7503]|uniref:TrkH family potassium uptake protein n=1 Tax=Clostridium sp. UBA7503 TaxID=1946377 RepID=UPI0032175D85